VGNPENQSSLSNRLLPGRHSAALTELSEMTSSDFDLLNNTLMTYEGAYPLKLLENAIEIAFPELNFPIILMTLLDYAWLIESGRTTKEELLEVLDNTLCFEPDNSIVISRLNTLLCQNVIVVLAKANSVLYDNQRNFVESRVLTDLRPVFTTAIDSRPTLAGIVHNLKVAYLENGSQHEFFVSLDEDDLDNLFDVITRAKKKAQFLRATVSPVIPIITEEFTTDG